MMETLPPQDLNLRPFLTLLTKEIKRFMRVLVQTVVTPLINSSLYLLIFGVSLGKSIASYHELSYLAFLVPGLVMMSALNNSFQNSSSSIVGSKFHGDLQDLRVVPLTSNQITWALSLGGLVRGFIVGGVTLFVSEIFFYFHEGHLLSIQHPLLMIVFLAIGTLCFATLGIVVGFRAKTFEQLNAIGSFVLLPLLYLGGVFFSISSLHPAWQTFSQLNPMLYFMNGMRYSILGVSDLPMEQSLVVSVVALIVLNWIASRSVEKGHFARW